MTSVLNYHFKPSELNSASSFADLNRLLVTVEWKCHLEGKVKKRFTLHARDGSRHVKILINARVMGKNKGTPMLKNGIKCIHIPDDSVSEASDWQGFD